ncbi:FtsX-like permease family protein [Actinoplanes sp. CA-142083]|uniref:FtsX-like permease family protein n=1 Tax=Actinoplanes sp. CA-142083 TaxID=3239903 RepID=UPI003D89FFED
MIRLVLAMVWTRRGQSLTLALLALLAVAAAVASPAYLAAADRAVAAGQIATASPAERGIVLSSGQDERGGNNGNPDFSNVGAALAGLPGFEYRFSAEFPAIGIEPDNVIASRVVFRQDACGHLRIVTGRCLIGEGEAILGAETAKRAGLAAGDAITLTFAKSNNDDHNPLYIPDGKPRRLYVAGTYTVPQPGDAYWGTHGYFTAVPGHGPGEPVFIGAATLAVIDHGRTEMAIDGTAGPEALNIDRLPQLRTGLETLKSQATKLGPTVQINTELPYLLDRIDGGRGNARLLVPVMAVPLVLLACFSIFLAVSYGAQGRQPELAIVALRGTRWWTRWWLAAGESLVAILAGAVAGCVAGQLLVNAVAAARFPGVGVAAGWSSLRYAPIAALAACAAAVLAQRRQLVSPVATLLRRNPGRVNGPRAVAVEAVIVLLAALSGMQLAVSGGELTGVALLAPAFAILALSLLAARALLPAVTRYATRALGAGRLGPALAAFQLSRRPGAQRLFALLVATVAVAGYAACAVDVAARGRDVQADLGVGAARVLSVDPVHRSRLLHAVEMVDPGGRFAMAVVRLPSSSADEALGLAVDSRRLEAVASWPGGGPSAREVASRLRPPAAEPTVLQGQDLGVTVTTTGMQKGKELKLLVAVSSEAGLGDEVVDFGTLRNGRSTYKQRVETCRLKCRINGIEVTIATTDLGVTGRVVINSLGSAGAALPAEALADTSRWRLGGLTGDAAGPGAVVADPGGLGIDATAPNGIRDGIWAKPVDAPSPLPAAYAGAKPAGNTVTGLDAKPLAVRPIDRLPAVPRVGDRATLVDLEYADRLSADAAISLDPQVWLNDRAPADILDRLAAQGLTITGDTRSDEVRDRLAEQGPALSLYFYFLAAGLSVLLGAGALVLAAAVDRERRVEDLSALRAQGLRRAVAGRATLWTYPVLVAIAAVAGVLTALAVWGLTGWALPLAGASPPALPLPAWPRILIVLATAAVVLLLLAAVAAGTGRDLHRRIDPAGLGLGGRRPGSGGPRPGSGDPSGPRDRGDRVDRTTASNRGDAREDVDR